jgi:hypothetical protein
MSEIEKLRALMAKATPGPWTTGQGDPEHVLSTVNWHCVAQANDALPNMKDNAALIAAAISALPALLDDLARLREDKEHLLGLMRRANEQVKIEELTVSFEQLESIHAAVRPFFVDEDTSGANDKE